MPAHTYERADSRENLQHSSAGQKYSVIKDRHAITYTHIEDMF